MRVGQLETQLYDACLGHQEEEARPSRRVDREEKADGSGDPGREEEKKVTGMGVVGRAFKMKYSRRV